jgi:serine/threonine protein kinase/lipopolysaccharide biosynthesis regulator YciM
MIGKTISHYKIIEKIGSGGMGDVYKAQDTTLERFVALKFLSSALSGSKEAKERFIQEAKAAAALNHPNICTIYEVAEADGQSFIAMEFIQGENLRDRILKKSLEIREITDIAIQIAKGLREAHSKGIVHRDIKSTNIMLTENGQVLITDFGLAKLAGSSFVTQENTTMGTVSYMSPEQIKGKNVDHRTDLWSLGVLIYEMISGNFPFTGEVDQAIIYSIMNEEPEDIPALKTDELKKLQSIITKLLSKELSDRYQRVDDFLLDLSKIPEILPDESPSKILAEIKLGSKRQFNFNKYWLIPILIILVTVTGIIIYPLFISNNFSERDWLLITDFENQSGEKILDGTIAEAISIDLNQSKYVNVFPRQRISEVLNRMEKADVKVIDEKIGREICIREGIKAMLVGSIGKVGTNYFFIIKVLNPSTGEAIVTERTEVSSVDNIFEAIDNLSRRIRRNLGESLSSIKKMDKPLDRVTTSSLQALQYYSIGREYGSRAQWIEAIPFYEKAIEEDSTFAMAYAHLGVLYHNMGKIEEAQFYSSLAIKWINNVTERERYYIEAEYYRYRYQYDKAIENYTLLAKLYPDDFTSYSNLAFIYQYTREYKKAIEPLKEAMRISPKSWYIYQNLGLNYGGLDSMDLAKQNFLKAVKMNPNQNWSYLGLSMVYLCQKDLEKALKQIDILFTSEEIWSSIGYEWRGSCYKYYGMYDKAISELTNGIKIDQRMNAKSREASKYSAIASIYYQKGNMPEYIKNAEKAVDLAPNTINLMKLGIAYAQNELFSKAMRMAKKIKNEITYDKSPIKQAEYNRVIGEIEFNKNNLNEAINYFEISKSLNNDLETIFSLALAYQNNGDFDKAIQEFQYLSKNKWATLFDGYAYLWPISQYYLGSLYDLKGNTESAQGYNQNFRELWQGADSDIKILRNIQGKLLQKSDTLITNISIK